MIGAAASLAVASIAGGIYLFTAPQKIQIPEKVCSEKLAGAQVEKLLPSEGEPQFTEETYGGNFGWVDYTISKGNCTLSAGQETVNVWYLYRHGDTYPQEEVQEDRRRVEWGEEYGYYEDGAFFMFVGCPRSTHDDQGKLQLAVRSSRAERSQSDAGKDISELASLTASVTRTLVTDMFKCRSAESLPEGPVEFSGDQP